MLKKIDLLTILGLLLLILSGIFYFNSFGNTYFPQNGLISISGILLGLLFIVIDFILIKRKDKNNEINSRITDFGKIIVVSMFAWFIDTIIFTTVTGDYGIQLGEVVCITVIIPAAIIGLGIFLIFVRTPLGKSITKKKVNIFCIVLAILLIILPVYAIWPSVSPTYMGRQSTMQLHLSSDGTRLLSISGMGRLASGNHRVHQSVYDYMIWDTISGKNIWNITSSNYFDAAISPDGKYFINVENNSILSIESGKTITPISGTYYDWAGNGKYYVTAQDKMINIWNVANFTKIKTIPINESIRKIALSPDGTKLTVKICNQTRNSLLVIDVLSDNSTYLYNYSGDSDIQYLSWSKRGDMLQMAKQVFTSNNSSGYFEHYILIVWNSSDNHIIHNISFSYAWGNMVMNQLFDVEFGKYVIYDDERSNLIFYNLTGAETVFNTNKNSIANFDLSSDDSIMAIGGGGIIEIKNATTGRLINTLKTPVYELERPIPGFEIIAVFCAIASIFILKRTRRKKY